MTFGDSNHYSVPTIYKGIKMRSALETKVAFFLDALNIKWKYEPMNFLLKSGINYKPDFFLPELKIWIEVKGVIEPHQKDIYSDFVKERNQELLVISSIENLYFFSWSDPYFDLNEEQHIGCDESVYIGKCSNCGSFFFCPNSGNYHCRKCQTHEGDHDLLFAFNARSFGDDEKIDFSDLNSIKYFLERWRLKI
jgi:hypothetical protein